MRHPTHDRRTCVADRAMAAAASLSVGAAAASAASLQPIDLSSWTAEGFTSNWSVAADGNSVFQTTNGPPTFFVSPGEFIDTTIRGSFAVETTGDDDLIGFVFGYNNPLGAETAERDFLLLDWKQSGQTFDGTVSNEGLALSRVKGNIPPGLGVAGSPEEVHYFFGRPDTGPTPDADGVIFDVLATDYGVGRGWIDNTVYDFELLYQTDRIRIRLSGGQFGTDLQTIFDIMAADAGVAAFGSGRFGFYNNSQSNVRYLGLTEEDSPLPPDDTGPPSTVIPTPAAMPAGVALLALLSVRRRRRRMC